MENIENKGNDLKIGDYIYYKSVIFRKIKKRRFSFYIIKTWKEIWHIKNKAL